MSSVPVGAHVYSVSTPALARILSLAVNDVADADLAAFDNHLSGATWANFSLG